MSVSLKARLKQLKFISSMFSNAMNEFNNVMGPESIQTIFRLMGEKVGETVEKRIKEKYKVDSWTPELFADKFASDVLEPAMGEGEAEISINGNELNVILKLCPFKKAGTKIDNKFYCTYTEGLIETAAKKAFPDVEFKSIKLRAVDNCDCNFSITIK